MRLVDSNNVIGSLDGVHNVTFIVSVMQKHNGMVKQGIEYPLFLTTGYVPHFRENFIIGKIYVKIKEMILVRTGAVYDYRVLCSVRKDFFSNAYSDVIKKVKPFVGETTSNAVNNYIRDITVYGYQYNIWFKMPNDTFGIDLHNENISELSEGFFTW